MIKPKSYLAAGRVISSAGDSIYQVAVMWYVYQLTQSAFYSGIGYAATVLPKVIQFLIGPIVDRGNKMRILISTQFIQGLVLMIVPLCMLMKVNNVWIVLSVVLLTAFLENFEGSAEWAVVPIIVDEEGIPKYNSIVSSAQQFFSLISGGLFGIIIIFVSIEYIYTINAITFIIAGILFRLLSKTIKKAENEKQEDQSDTTYFSSLKDGFKVFFGGGIVLIIMPLWLTNFSLGMINAALPAYASKFLEGNSYGYFILAIGAGSLIGTLSAFKMNQIPQRILFILLPIISAGFFLSSIIIANIIGKLVLFGAAFIPFGIITLLMMSYLQQEIPKDYLARMITIIDSMMISTLPIGSIIGGILASRFDSSYVLLIGGAGFVFISIYFAWNPKIKGFGKAELAIKAVN